MLHSIARKTQSNERKSGATQVTSVQSAGGRRGIRDAQARFGGAGVGQAGLGAQCGGGCRRRGAQEGGGKSKAVERRTVHGLAHGNLLGVRLSAGLKELTRHLKRLTISL